MINAHTFVARAAAVLAGVCVAVHLIMVLVMPSFLALPMIVLAIVCAMCGRHLWQRSEPKIWAGMVTGTLTMLALHALALNTPTSTDYENATSAHHSSASPLTLSLPWLDHDALLVVASAAATGELLLAVLALVLIATRPPRRTTLTPAPLRSRPRAASSIGRP